MTFFKLKSGPLVNILLLEIETSDAATTGAGGTESAEEADRGRQYDAIEVLPDDVLRLLLEGNSPQ